MAARLPSSLERALDGSDDPLGLCAFAALAAAGGARLAGCVCHRARLAERIDRLALAANRRGAGRSGVAVALLAALCARRRAGGLVAGRRPLASLTGLVLLALPLIASLQFYVGWPLRVLTAELSAWGLQSAGLAAARSGSSMLVQRSIGDRRRALFGRADGLVGYFTPAQRRLVGAARRPLRAAAAAGRCAGAVGNVLRNSVLVALGVTARRGLSGVAHQAIGLVGAGRGVRQRLCRDASIEE